MIEKQIHQQSKQLMEESDSFLISTIDRNNFPSIIVVSPPIFRNKLRTLCFYINGDGKTADNIRRNPLGCICCYKEKEHESLSMKGNFRIVEIKDVSSLKGELTDHQKDLDYEYPVMAEFKAMSIKVHNNLKTRTVQVSEME